MEIYLKQQQNLKRVWVSQHEIGQVPMEKSYTKSIHAKSLITPLMRGKFLFLLLFFCLQLAITHLHISWYRFSIKLHWIQPMVMCTKLVHHLKFVYFFFLCFRKTKWMINHFLAFMHELKNSLTVAASITHFINDDQN